MAQGIKILYEGGSGELEEKKSRFIANTLPISTQEEAIEFIEKIKKQYWDARHNCYAYVLGDRHEIQRFSDDGEPGGTAGKPMLDVLLGEDIHNIVVVVTRYFGGTLLGTGGLVRAYSGATKEGLAGSVIATLNFFLMAMSVELAADKAEQQDVRGGQALISLSYGFRLIALFVILVVCAKTEIFHLLALVIPLAFTRPVLTVAEFFKKKGEHDA